MTKYQVNSILSVRHWHWHDTLKFIYKHHCTSLSFIIFIDSVDMLIGWSFGRVSSRFRTTERVPPPQDDDDHDDDAVITASDHFIPLQSADQHPAFKPTVITGHYTLYSDSRRVQVGRSVKLWVWCDSICHFIVLIDARYLFTLWPRSFSNALNSCTFFRSVFQNGVQSWCGFGGAVSSLWR